MCMIKINGTHARCNPKGIEHITDAISKDLLHKYLINVLMPLNTVRDMRVRQGRIDSREFKITHQT